MSLKERFIHVFEIVRCLLFGYCAYTPRRARAKFAASADETFDAIIVPGVPFDGKDWGKVMEARIRWSFFLYESGRTRFVIYSGGAVHSPYCEAEIMRLYALELGIAPEHILVETRAEHSRENVFYSSCLARKNGLTRLALATDPFQAKMLEGFVRRKIDPRLAVLPIVAEKLGSTKAREPRIDPATAHVTNFVPLKKRQSFLTRLRGMLGLNLPADCDLV